MKKAIYRILFFLMIGMMLSGKMDIYAQGNASSSIKVTMSKSKYVYDGKVHKPVVTVKKNGKKILSKYYTVKYDSGRKKVGSYKVVVKMKGPYKGTYRKTFKIIPKATSITSLKSGTSSITVKWKKRTTQVSGYQIQKANNKSFTKGVKTFRVTSSKKLTKKISSLSGGKKYYIRVRTYKDVTKNGKTKRYYSKWSKVKNISTINRIKVYRKFYENNFKNRDNTWACAVDVTRDGRRELIVVDLSDQFTESTITGYVYTIKNEKVVCIQKKVGATVHAGGFFAWYLYKTNKGICLAEEFFGMWQGRGDVSFTAYFLNENGKKIIHKKVGVSSSDPESSDADGVVTEEAFNNYREKLSNELMKCETLCVTYSEGYFEPLGVESYAIRLE